MNNIINELLLAGDKFMPEMHLRQLQFVYSARNKIIKQSNRKPNKIWVDQGSEFYNNVFKKWLSDNDIIMYLT